MSEHDEVKQRFYLAETPEGWIGQVVGCAGPDRYKSGDTIILAFRDDRVIITNPRGPVRLDRTLFTTDTTQFEPDFDALVGPRSRPEQEEALGRLCQHVLAGQTYVEVRLKSLLASYYSLRMRLMDLVEDQTSLYQAAAQEVAQRFGMNCRA